MLLQGWFDFIKSSKAAFEKRTHWRRAHWRRKPWLRKRSFRTCTKRLDTNETHQMLTNFQKNTLPIATEAIT